MLKQFSQYGEDGYLHATAAVSAVASVTGLPAVSPASQDAIDDFHDAWQAVFFAMAKIADAKIRMIDELARHRADAKNIRNIRKMLEAPQ